MFPIGLQGADGWSAPFDNPWTTCDVGESGVDQYDCRLSPAQQPNGLTSDSAGVEWLGGPPCIPSNLYHAQMAQQLEPRLGSVGPFNVNLARNASTDRYGAGATRQDQEVWERLYWGYDSRCGVYHGEGPGYDAAGTCPWDVDGNWDPAPFDPNTDYLGLEDPNAGSCGANPDTGVRRVDIETLVIASITHRGMTHQASFPGREAWVPNLGYALNKELLSLNWVGEDYIPACAVPYRSSILRDPDLSSNGQSCDQCLFDGWDDLDACQSCLALTPAGQTALTKWVASDFPIDPAADLASLDARTAYPVPQDPFDSEWLVQMPPTVLDCPNLPAVPSVLSYSKVDVPALTPCLTGGDPGCETWDYDADLCSRLVPLDGKNCVNLLGQSFAYTIGGANPPTPVAAYCPDQWGHAGSGLNYRWYARPECPLDTTPLASALPTMATVEDADGAWLRYPGGTPPWNDDFNHFYAVGWNEGGGTNNYPSACMDAADEFKEPLACHAEGIATLDYDLDGDGDPNEVLANVIGFAQPDEMGIHAARAPAATYLTPNLRFSPWLHESCLMPTAYGVRWQIDDLCQRQGRATVEFHTDEVGRMYSASERAAAREHREQVESELIGDTLVFAQDKDFMLLADQLHPVGTAPSNATVTYEYPFRRLLSAVGDTAYSMAYLRPLTFARDKMRAHHEFSKGLADDPAADRAAYPVWWAGQVIGHPDCNGCASWGTAVPGLGELDRARPALEQMRVEAWTAIAEGLDGLMFFQDACPAGVCPTIQSGWEFLAASNQSQTRPLPMTLGEQLLEVSGELRAHHRIFEGRLLEYDLTDDGVLDPWEEDRNGPLLSDTAWPYNPPDLFPKPANNPIRPLGPNFIDTDGDHLIDEGVKQYASAAVFENLWPGTLGMVQDDRYVVLTNLAECTKWVDDDVGFQQGFPSVPTGFEPLVEAVNQATTTVAEDRWNKPCAENSTIEASSSTIIDVNGVPTSVPADPIGSVHNYYEGPYDDWRSWQATGGLFTGIDNEVVLRSTELRPGLLYCKSLTEEDLTDYLGLDPLLWPGANWPARPAVETQPGTVEVDFTGVDALLPYDVVVCYQDEAAGTWLPWSTPTPYPAAEQSMQLGWAVPSWMMADPTLSSAASDAMLVDMCARPEGVGFEACDHSLWDWLTPTPSQPGFALCTGCSDGEGGHGGGQVEEATDSWVWLAEPGSGYAEYDFSHILTGTLCLDLQHDYDPGWDDISGATVFDRASVQVTSADGCPILGFGAPGNSCPAALTTSTAWSRQDAGGGGVADTAVDLSAWLGQPVSIGLRYEAWEDGVRTDGPGWMVERAQVRWFDDESQSCAQLLGQI